MMVLGDARALPMEDESVDCIVTSPPYNVGMEYVGVSDHLSHREYEDLAESTCAEMARVLKWSGRVWLNVAAQTNHEDGNGRRGNLTWLWSRALEDHGLWYRDTVVWHKPTGNNSTAWGSKLSPNAPNLRGRWEPILLHFKGEWSRGRIEQNDITMPEFLEATRNVWTIGTTGPSTNGGHPAPFPAEIPRRAILLSTWPGDVVLDPFAGSGTTVRIAHQLGRRAVGVDLSARYVAQWHERGVQEVMG